MYERYFKDKLWSDLLTVKFFTSIPQSSRNFGFLLFFVFLLHHPSYIFQATCWHLCKCCDRVRDDACKFCALSFCSKSCRVGETTVPHTDEVRQVAGHTDFIPMFDTPMLMLFRTLGLFVHVCGSMLRAFCLSRNLSMIFANYRIIRRTRERDKVHVSTHKYSPRKQFLVRGILWKLLSDTVIKWWANFSKCMRDTLLLSFW